ncbi:TPA: NUDIX hydrolase [Candidatus Woesearchaeota archaeon]|nr:NUDIX hydrolase [Candidatus Woesearchaeota archaeon]HII64276.1 NUDIX hydrolase [Candidatus Woesearchaeota archaeon]HIJ18586.1 NUDIX hydrolase [Candidatus Woesearchaeota archaeon]
MKTYFVVTGIVRNGDGRILLLRKSMNDRIYPGKWSFCSGYVKEFEAAEDTVLREIEEETGLKGAIERKGNLVEVIDGEKQRHWIVACYLCTVPSDEVRLCHENTEFRWVLPEDIAQFDLVPGLEKDLKALGVA